MLWPIKKFLFFSQPGSCAQGCEISTLEEYAAKYLVLAAMLDRPDRIDAAPGHPRPQSAHGLRPVALRFAQLAHCLFLTAFTSIIAPPASSKSARCPDFLRA
jgi:hypothetical protein